VKRRKYSGRQELAAIGECAYYEAPSAFHSAAGFNTFGFRMESVRPGVLGCGIK
jgi:hypothetical protein